MQHSSVTDELRETLTLFAFDLLEPGEKREIEEHLSQCSCCWEELRQLKDTQALLPRSLDRIQPHPRVKRQLLSMIKTPAPAVEQPLPGIFVKRDSGMPWKPSGYPGVDVRTLYFDKPSGSVTSLLRIHPGGEYPPHRHASAEQCLVLEGTVRIGSLMLQAGDFEWASAGTLHHAVTSDTGCVLLIISNHRDEILT